MRRGPVWIIAAIGVGLVAAPLIFQMFTRAPQGGQMINEFEPFMSESRLERFDGFLTQIDAAHEETSVRTEEALDDEPQQLEAFNRRWPAVHEDMSGMVATIRANLDNFAAVDALPPFPLFPWFFVVPGVLLWFTARSALKSSRYTYPRGRMWFLAVMGAGLIAAPAIFQMFTRAPLGASMIEDFKPLMTESRITQIQDYFLTIAGAEGDIRLRLKPAAENFEREFPASAAFVDDWQVISSEMAPMVGTMSDNVDNFAAVAALPPFSLFPWFFVAPGVLVLALSASAMRRRPSPAVAVATDQPVVERGGVA